MRKFRKAGQSRHLKRWLFVLGLILLSGSGGCDRRNDQPNEPKLADHQQLEALSTRLGALENAVQQQSAVLRKILDNASPARMPPGWESLLTQLEDQVNNDTLWPKDAGEAGRFLEQARELVTSLPARAEPQYLPRLSPVRWAAMAFVSLNHPTDTGQPPHRLAQLVDELRALADARPEGSAEALGQALGERAAELAGEAVRRRYSEAVQQAERYLEGAPGAAADLVRLYESLESYVAGHGMDGIDVDVRALWQRLYKEMLRRQAVEQAAALMNRWKTAQRLEDHEPALYDASARMLLRQVASARVALVLEGVTAPVHDGLETELRDAVDKVEVEAAQRAEKRQAQALRLYQRWTLSEIKKFEDAVQGISDKVAETESWLDSVKPLLDSVNPWPSDDPDYEKRRRYVEAGQYQEVGQAMIEHLLPVNVALLDLPVHERYRQAFQTGWRKLEGRDDQTDVATASAVAEKKSLREFLEDGS